MINICFRDKRYFVVSIGTANRVIGGVGLGCVDTMTQFFDGVEFNVVCKLEEEWRGGK